MVRWMIEVVLCTFRYSPPTKLYPPRSCVPQAVSAASRASVTGGRAAIPERARMTYPKELTSPLVYLDKDRTDVNLSAYLVVIPVSGFLVPTPFSFPSRPRASDAKLL
ncbi:hypothetical protein KL86APRO_20449 [uncultured Alphaproteobacteria bacterium]|uniref:Uncharacterized protein n=1 Tax=uncultured Alphaproteobacteria bacterium TaxID=91750 RepID=A0A212KKD2_9PROT|nr:hypothetical protein KL86APRO_20449 [uncultured Alphaproteobacteria bacterium]